MADKDNIDKVLPNVDQDVPLPEEEIVVSNYFKQALPYPYFTTPLACLYIGMSQIF